VPETPHIGAYPRALPDRDRLPRRDETPASDHILLPLVPKTGLIAMQKVEGSNPFSRFPTKPLQTGASSFLGRTEPPPHIASVLGTSSQNGVDARRLATISVDFAWRRSYGRPADVG
jgi:hypothetical protein